MLETMLEKEKRKQAPRRILPFVIGGLICLFVGLAGGYVLHNPEKIYVYTNVDTTPQSFTAIYAAQDIPCGARIEPDMVLEVHPEQIIVDGLYPNGITGYNDLMTTVPGQYARYPIKKGMQLYEGWIVAEPYTCPTPASP
jgi:hypothetical protein